MSNSYKIFNAHRWVRSLPPTKKWDSNFISTLICSNSNGSALHLCVIKSKNVEYTSIYFAIRFVRFGCEIHPPRLTEESQFQTLWNFKPIELTASVESSLSLMGDEAVYNLFINLIEGVIGVHDFSVKDSKLDSPDIFNLCFLTNLFLAVEWHGTPNMFSKLIQPSKTHVETSSNSLKSLQSSRRLSKVLCSDSSELLGFLSTLHNQLNCSELRYAQKMLVNMLESNFEVKWLRSVNSAITSWYLKSDKTLTRPVPTSLSRSFSVKGFWQVQLYYPLLAMKEESSYKSGIRKLLCHKSGKRKMLRYKLRKKKLLRSLYNHQLEGVIQIHYEVDSQEDWVVVAAHIENIRIDVVTLNEERKFENPVIDEKHFPSLVSLNLNPICPSSVMSLTIRQSSCNPQINVGVQRGTEIGLQTGIEFESPKGPKPIASVGVKRTAGTTVSTSIYPWQYGQYPNNDSKGATISWVLYDSVDGQRKVFSSEPPKMPHPWFSNRNSNAKMPFTEQGGVIFADDMYGQRISWRMHKSAIRDTMEWEIKGTIGLTYWPNKLQTSFWENRSAEFREVVHVNFT